MGAAIGMDTEELFNDEDLEDACASSTNRSQPGKSLGCHFSRNHLVSGAGISYKCQTLQKAYSFKADIRGDERINHCNYCSALIPLLYSNVPFCSLQPAAELIDSEFRPGMSNRQKNKAKRMAKLVAKQRSRDVDPNEKR